MWLSYCKDGNKWRKQKQFVGSHNAIDYQSTEDVPEISFQERIESLIDVNNWQESESNGDIDFDESIPLKYGFDITKLKNEQELKEQYIKTAIRNKWDKVIKHPNDYMDFNFPNGVIQQ